jgi:hypothetical protein
LESTGVLGRPLVSILNLDHRKYRPFGDTVVYSKQPAGKVLFSGWIIRAVHYRRAAILRAGSFNEKLGVGEDSEFQW